MPNRRLRPGRVPLPWRRSADVTGLGSRCAVSLVVRGRDGRRCPRLTDHYDIAMFRAVRLVTAPDVVAWLETHPEMEWDAGNSTKSRAKHGYYTADVESIFDAPVVFAGRIVEPAHEEARYLLLGVTWDGRHAALIFARRGDKLRPISCRAMRKKEKEAYDGAT